MSPLPVAEHIACVIDEDHMNCSLYYFIKYSVPKNCGIKSDKLKDIKHICVPCC